MSRAGTAWETLRHRGGGEDALLDTMSLEAARDLALQARDVPGVSRAAAMAYGYIVRQEDFLGG